MGSYVTFDSVDTGRSGYVTFDSLDAGRQWNCRPPGIGHVSDLRCIPSNKDGGLSQFEFIAAIAPIAGAAITAGGAIGAAAITANANKYAVKQQTKADLQIALARQKSELEQAKATLEAGTIAQKETTVRTKIQADATTRQASDVTSNVVPLVGILGLAGIAALIILKD